MSYKLFEVTSLYKNYINYFYDKFSEIASLSYSDLYNAIINDCFAECDFLHKELNKLGVETKLVFYNDNHLQLKYFNDEVTDLFEIFIRQLKEFDPDILYVSDIGTFTKEQYSIIRESLKPNAKMIAWHFTVVECFSKLLPLFDEVYTGSKYIMNLLIPYCKSVKLLYHAFEPNILNKINYTEKFNKLLFAGSIYLGEDIHNNRIDMFGEFKKKNIDCDFYGNIYGSFLPNGKKDLIKFLFEKNTLRKKRHIIEKEIRTKIKPSAFGLDYYSLLSKYNLCMNQHVKIAGTGAGNMRMFEVTGMGTCLVTDYKDENKDLFVPDEEIVVYKNYDELLEKVNWLLNNPRKANEIALKGQKRTISSHSYKHKAEVFNNYILGILYK